MAVADHPRLLPGNRHLVMTLDRAFTDQVSLTAHLEQVLGGRVHVAQVQRLDLANDTTVVDVRYEVPRSGSPALARAAR